MNYPACVVCGSSKHNYLYTIHATRLWECAECGLISSFPHLDLDAILSFYGKASAPIADRIDGITETEASQKYIDLLLKRSNGQMRIILIAPSGHAFSSLAKGRGIEVVRSMDINEFENGLWEYAEAVDAIVFLYQLEQSKLPQQVLRRAFDLLQNDGILFVVSPSLDSRPARFFGTSWTELRPENKYYFDGNTIQSLLLKHGFDRIEIQKDARLYTFEHINERAVAFPNTWLTRGIRTLYSILPQPFRGMYFRLPSSGMVLSAQKGKHRLIPLLSIVMPVYNESSTFPVIVSKLLNKKIDGVEKELIIVESNSSDNSRELVLQHQDNPAVKIILQDKPRGKGNAVRAGVEVASGDILMIQDADLEYDINDYEALLEPILSYKKAFVLGSRHGGRWKMRHFNDQQQLSAYFNFGHVLFTFLMNMMYGQRMKDPFTMFKVFRRDCLHSMILECNRFDFDFELVIKLIRKGYIPLEIPVNYDSRSFTEGKKVQMFRDPLTWIRALIKYRFAKITKD